jgi:hypothetical protein
MAGWKRQLIDTILVGSEEEAATDMIATGVCVEKKQRGVRTTHRLVPAQGGLRLPCDKTKHFLKTIVPFTKKQYYVGS